MPGPCSAQKRWQIVTLVEEGYQFKDIARRLRVGRNTVGRVMNLYRRTGQVVPGKSTGRPRKTTEREDRRLFTLVRRNRQKSARWLRGEWVRTLNVPVSTRTTNRRVLRQGYNARRPAQKPMLTRRHRHERLAWAAQWRDLTVNHWNHVIFADESRYLLHRTDGRVRVRRLVGERFHDDCVQETVAHGGGSVHVWGAMHAGGKSQLVVLEENVNGVRYRDILQQHMLPWARATFGDNFAFQDDNAPPHRARVTTNFLEEEGVQMRPQPAKSPDVNPIEHLWDELQRAVDQRDVKPATLHDLAAALIEEWEILPAERLQNLVNSMPRRLQAVINSRGGHTRY